jgi:predicted DNA-binding transcriptional regulator
LILHPHKFIPHLTFLTKYVSYKNINKHQLTIVYVMVTVQSQSGLFVKKAEAREGKIRVTGRKVPFRRAAYSVLVEDGEKNTVIAGTLQQVSKMLMHKRLVREAARVVEAVSHAVRDDTDLFDPVAVTGGISGTLSGSDIACLVAVKHGVNETTEIAEAFGISYLKVHARLMALRREGLVCREDGILLKYFLTARGLETVFRGMREEPFVQSKEWLRVRRELGSAQTEVPANSY